MFTFLAIALLITAIILAGIILIQSSKGGGLAGNLSGGNQYMGVQKTTEGLEKITWGFATGLMVLAIFAAFALPAHNKTIAKETVKESKLKDNVSSMPQTMPPAGSQPSTTASQPAK